MYDENPHLSNPKAAEKLSGGSYIHALATLYTGMVLYNEQNKSHPSKNAPWLALFIVLNACLLLYLNARSMFAISLREMI